MGKFKITIIFLFCGFSVVNSYILHFMLPQFRQFLGEQRTQMDLFELLHRQKVFFRNFEDIENLSNQFPSANFGVNEFSHLTPEEFRKKYFGNHFHHRKRTNSSHASKTTKTQAPKSLDYRSSGKVSPVKNQRECGACWAFVVTAAIESQYLIHKNQLLDLSEQELVSCVNGNYGCYGGDVVTTYQWIQGNGGQIQESEYPFKGEQESCPISKTQKYPISGFLWAGTREDDIAAFIAEHGPATIAIDMPNFLQHYVGGVIDLDAQRCRKISAGGHGMLLVGYTSDYWIAKNSWGPKWGENGYIRFVKGKNFCSMTLQVTVPTIP